MQLDAAWRSHPGLVREHNEDAVLCLPQEGGTSFFAVADGVGGAVAGELASGAVVDAIRREYGNVRGRHPAERLARLIEQANAALFGWATQRPEYRGMASTVVAAAIFHDTLYVAHVGDSRAYLVRRGRPQRLTRDHSYVAEQVAAGQMTPEEALVSPYRHVITRSVGGQPEVAVDTLGPMNLEPDDVLVLCSDGLHEVVSDDEIALATRGSAAESAGTLVALALDRGGPDNVSVVVVRSTP